MVPFAITQPAMAKKQYRKTKMYTERQAKKRPQKTLPMPFRAKAAAGHMHFFLFCLSFVLSIRLRFCL